jgi:hypothetical protein
MTALSQTAEHLRTHGASVDFLEDEYGGWLTATLGKRTVEVHMNFDDERQQVMRLAVHESTDCAIIFCKESQHVGDVALLLLEGLEVETRPALAPRWYERLFRRVRGVKS